MTCLIGGCCKGLYCHGVQERSDSFPLSRGECQASERAVPVINTMCSADAEKASALTRKAASFTIPNMLTH